jgi:Type IV secretion system pilin
MQLETIILNIYEYILNPVIQAGFAVALIVFLWGCLQFIIYKQQGDSSKIADLKKHMIYGVLGMFIMASVFGILQVIANTVRAGQSLL